MLPIAAVGCVSSTADPGPPPTLVVDAEHAQVGRPDGGEGTTHKVAPSTRLMIDDRRFDFSTSHYPDVQPNAVHLVIGSDRQYSASWDSSGLTELSSSTLTPINSSRQFEGFHTGDRIILAGGEQRLDGEKEAIVLKVLWAGLIEVL